MVPAARTFRTSKRSLSKSVGSVIAVDVLEAVDVFLEPVFTDELRLGIANGCSRWPFSFTCGELVLFEIRRGAGRSSMARIRLQGEVASSAKAFVLRHAPAAGLEPGTQDRCPCSL